MSLPLLKATTSELNAHSKDIPVVAIIKHSSCQILYLDNIAQNTLMFLTLNCLENFNLYLKIKIRNKIEPQGQYKIN